MADSEGKKLTELRVIDLKTELERRGLDKTGNKATLLDRLSKAISDEGKNPEEYLIVPSIGPSKISPRKNSGTGTANLDESMDTHETSKEESSDNQESADTKTKEEANPPASTTT